MSKVVAFLFLLVPLTVNAQERRTPTAIDRIRATKSTVVQIGFISDLKTTGSIPREPQRAGTGFFVTKEGYVLTAGHVIRGTEAAAKAKGATKVTFMAGLLLDPSSMKNLHFKGSFSWAEASVVDIDDFHDLALLKLSQNPFDGGMTSGIQLNGKFLPLSIGIARLDATLPAEGDDVLVSGYPLEIPTFVSQRGMVASESYSPGHTQPQGFPENEDSILLDAAVNPGNSGGPVYLTGTGDVIGVCEAYEFSPLMTNKGNDVQVAPGEFLKQNAGLAVVIPIEYAIELLGKNKVLGFLLSKNASTQKVH